MAKPKRKYINKKPLWQWVIIYLITGGIIYASLYFLGFVKLGDSGGSIQENPFEIQYFE